MRNSSEGADTGAPPVEPAPVPGDSTALLGLVLDALDDAKALDVMTIDLAGKSAIGDFMVVASGRSHRHVGAVADRVLRKLKDEGCGRARVEGLPACDWVLIDTGDIIVHVFRPEVRDFYNLEKFWSAERPAGLVAV